MPKDKLAVSLILCAFAAYAAAAHAAAADPDPQALFEQGKAAIDANEPERLDATYDGMANAAELIEQAIKGGYRDRSGAYMVLGNVYLTLSHWSRHGDTMDARIKRKAADRARARTAFENALKAAPNNAHAASAIAATARDDRERVHDLERVLEIDPNHVKTHLALGSLLMSYDERSPQFEKGLQHLMRAAEVAGPAEAPDVRWRVISNLEGHGRHAEAQELRKRYKKDLEKPAKRSGNE
jgi:hypothetical protein